MARTETKNSKSRTSAIKVVESNCLKPAPLKKGDKVAIVATASRPEGPHVVAAAVHILSTMGYVPVVGKNVLSIHGYMAGTDAERASDFNGFVKDKSIRAIFCITGGYGSLRIIDRIDYDALVRDPKVIVGGDDNTCLLSAINHVTGLVCFHGPNLDRINSQSILSELSTTISESQVLKPIESLESFLPGFVFAPVGGTAEGALIGGNLTALFSLLGTKYKPDFKNKLLFLEDKNERNDVLERWLTGLHLSGNLRDVNAVIMGVFENCGTGGSSNMLSLEDVFSERLKELKKPSCFKMSIGQTAECRFVPIGIRARVDTKKGRIEFLEPAIQAE